MLQYIKLIFKPDLYTMQKKKIELTVDQARSLLGKDEAMDILIRSNFSEEELDGKMTWERLPKFNGWYIENMSNLIYATVDGRGQNNSPTAKNVFATNNQARGVLAMAQLSQLMKYVNNGWVPDWSNGYQCKFTILPKMLFNKMLPGKESSYSYPYFLAFPTQEIRDKFLVDYKDLIEEFFLIYK